MPAFKRQSHAYLLVQGQSAEHILVQSNLDSEGVRELTSADNVKEQGGYASVPASRRI